ncbi:MAG: hypothetical protein RL071_2076 [Pseudomonadota bacterium]|jgi:hypothetical protein
MKSLKALLLIVVSASAMTLVACGDKDSGGDTAAE